MYVNCNDNTLLYNKCAGHLNERNFVGMSVTSDGYIACGSEDNAIYTYYRTLPMPLARPRLRAHWRGIQLIYLEN